MGSRKAFKKAVMSQAIGVRRWEMPDVASTVDSCVHCFKMFKRCSKGFEKNPDHIPSLSTVLQGHHIYLGMIVYACITN